MKELVELGVNQKIVDDIKEFMSGSVFNQEYLSDAFRILAVTNCVDQNYFIYVIKEIIEFYKDSTINFMGLIEFVSKAYNAFLIDGKEIHAVLSCLPKYMSISLMNEICCLFGQASFFKFTYFEFFYILKSFKNLDLGVLALSRIFSKLFQIC